jgi:hypothetical protein
MAFGGPNQTATPVPVVDFTPQKNYLSFSSIINQLINVVTYLTTTVTLLYSDVLGGFIILTNGSAIAATLPSAALLVPQIEGAQVGSSIHFLVKAGGAGTVTVAAGTGGTINGTATVATLNIKEFLLVVTGVGSNPSYVAYSLGTSVY